MNKHKVIRIFGEAADAGLHQISIKDLREIIGQDNDLDDAMAAARGTGHFGAAIERSSKSGYRVGTIKTKPMRSGVNYVNDLHQWAKVVQEVMGKAETPEKKVRPCMRCRRDFISEWKGNRLCVPCKASTDNGRAALI